MQREKIEYYGKKAYNMLKNVIDSTVYQAFNPGFQIFIWQFKLRHSLFFPTRTEPALHPPNCTKNDYISSETLGEGCEHEFSRNFSKVIEIRDEPFSSIPLSKLSLCAALDRMQHGKAVQHTWEV
jgi:hypothetical protein